MKKVILTSVVAFMALVFTACHSSDVKQEEKSNVTVDNQEAKDLIKSNIETSQQVENFDEQLRKANEATSKAKEIPVGQENFQKLVSFIEKRGFVVAQNDIPCDYQYTFNDSKGNRHAMMTIKRDDTGNPSMKGAVNQISVWAYYNGIRDQKHFFGYKITADKVAPFLPEIDGTWKEADDVKLGYEEFLKKVNK